jgi:hypothetical protein
LKRRELGEVARKLDGLLEAIADGLRSAGLQGKLEELERRKAELEVSVGNDTTSVVRLHAAAPKKPRSRETRPVR